VRLFRRKFKATRCRQCKLPTEGWFIRKCKCDWKDLMDSHAGIGNYVQARRIFEKMTFEVPLDCLLVMDEIRGLGNRTPIIS